MCVCTFIQHLVSEDLINEIVHAYIIYVNQNTFNVSPDCVVIYCDSYLILNLKDVSKRVKKVSAELHFKDLLDIMLYTCIGIHVCVFTEHNNGAQLWVKYNIKILAHPRQHAFIGSTHKVDIGPHIAYRPNSGPLH